MWHRSIESEVDGCGIQRQRGSGADSGVGVLRGTHRVSIFGRHAGHGQRLTPLQCDGKIAGQAREVHRRRVRVHIQQYSHYISEH
jgi:hypothetical protein